MEDRKLFKLLFVSWIVLEVCICVCVCVVRHLNASPIDGDKTAPFLHFFC